MTFSLRCAMLGAALLFPLSAIAEPAETIEFSPAAHHVSTAANSLQFSANFARPSYGQTRVGAGFITIHNPTA